jgi:poly(A) polymerase
MNSKTFFHSELTEKFPAEVKKIFQIFNERQDDSIRLVGGCVRDLLFTKTVNDFDFATKFLPQETIKILEENKIQAVPTGLKYGTVTAVVNHKNFEITTLRRDLESDGRHAQAEFVDDYFSDAARRDFTINALYLDFAGLVTDYFDGISDLKNKKVKFIGDENLRITEDFLRILRFFRFSCICAENYDLQGLKASIVHKENLKTLSADRVRNEIFKIFSKSENSKLISLLKLLEETEIRSEIFAAPFQITNLDNLFKLEETLSIKVPQLFKFFVATFDKESELSEIFVRLNFSNQQKDYFLFLLKNFSIKPKILDRQSLKELLVFEEKSLVRDFYLFGLVKNFVQVSIIEAQENLNFIDNFDVPEFPLRGEDVMALGFRGIKVGKALEAAKRFWVKNDFKPRRQSLLEFITSHLL